MRVICRLFSVLALSHFGENNKFARFANARKHTHIQHTQKHKHSHSLHTPSQEKYTKRLGIDENNNNEPFLDLFIWETEKKFYQTICILTELNSLTFFSLSFGSRIIFVCVRECYDLFLFFSLSLATFSFTCILVARRRSIRRLRGRNFFRVLFHLLNVLIYSKQKTFFVLLIWSEKKRRVCYFVCSSARYILHTNVDHRQNCYNTYAYIPHHTFSVKCAAHLI